MGSYSSDLSAYHYDIQFNPTAQHGNVDELSRFPLPSVSGEEEMHEAAVTHIINLKQISKLPITAARRKEFTTSDSVLSKVLHYTQRGWPESIDDKLRPFFVSKEELTVENGCLF